MASLAGHVDHVVIGIDSKTTDDTEEKAYRHDKPENYRVHTFPFTLEQGVDKHGVPVEDFATARNMAFGKALEIEGVDWVVWIDTDDVLGTDADLHDILGQQPANVSHVFVPYAYHRNEQGVLTTIFDRERAFRREAAPFWVRRIHERCEARRYTKAVKEERFWMDHVNASRAGTRDTRGERNFRVLRHMIDENPNDAEAMRYLGHQHFAANQWREAAEWYEKYLNTPSAEHGSEKWQILIWLARARRNEGDVPASVKAASLALQAYPQWPDAYFELSHSYAMKEQWRKAVEFHEMGLAKTDRPPEVLIGSPQDYASNPYRVAHTCYYHLGQFSEAIDAVTKALEWDQGDHFLKFRGRYYVGAWNRSKAIDALLMAVRYLVDNNEPLKARRLLASFPAGAEEERTEITGARAHVAQALAHLENEATYENLYFAEQKETIDPLAHLSRAAEFYPRMEWVAQRLRTLTAELERPLKVLEVGIGNAVQGFHIAATVPDVRYVGIDIDPRRVADANWNAVKLGYQETEDRSHEVLGVIADAQKKHDEEVAYRALLEKAETVTPELLAAQDEKIASYVKRLEVLQEELDVMPKRPITTEDTRVQFHWSPFNEVLQKVKALGPYDVVVATEVIEHVEDEAALLTMLETVNDGEHGDDVERILSTPPPRVILTTPDGAWRGAQDRNPSHVQVWSRLEFETLIQPRGVIYESRIILHPANDQPNIALEYTPGHTAKARFLDQPPVSIYCGPGWEKWSPEQVDAEGLGGSETAVVHVARLLALRNQRVTVYADVEGVFEGVRYRKWQKFNRTHNAWQVISWRHPDLFDEPTAANFNLLWAHDLDYREGVTPERMRHVDSLLVVSEFHRRHWLERYPWMGTPFRCGQEDHAHGWRCSTAIEVVYNGIDPAKFAAADDEPRDLNRVIYSSSPDRGLEQVLTYWPRIHEIEEDATLHIYYGWNNYDRMGGSQEYKRKIIALAQQPGVEWHGRMGQAALAREMTKASVVFYPGPHPFEETFGITFVEAQAAGCIPVTRDNGALPEVNKFGKVLPTDDTTPERWVLSVIEALGTSRRRRQEATTWARTCTWGVVADRMTNEALRLTRLAYDDEQARDKAAEPEPVAAE